MAEQPQPMEIIASLLDRIDTDLKAVRVLFAQVRGGAPPAKGKKRCPKCQSTNLIETMGDSFMCVDCGYGSDDGDPS
jgi:ribosomal protein S27AE